MTTNALTNAFNLSSTSSTAVSIAGLSLVVNIKQSEYVSQVGSTAGIVVLPLNQNIMPFPEDDGILVRPGFATSIGLTTVCAVTLLLAIYRFGLSGPWPVQQTILSSLTRDL